MALGNDNFSVAGVQNILELGRNSLEQNISYIYGEGNQFDAEIERISNLIEQVKDREKEVLALFGCSSPEEFRKRILEAYDKSGLNVFIGMDLQKSFLKKYGDALETKKNNKGVLYKQILNQIINVVNAEVQVSGEDVNKAFHKAIRPTKESGIVNVSEKGGVVNLTSKNFFEIDQNQIVGIYLDEITDPIENRINHILNDRQWKQNFPGLKNLDKRVKKTKNGLTITTSSFWFNATQGLKPSQVEDMIKKNPDAATARDKANEEILQELSKYVTDKSFQEVFEKEVRNMLKQSPNMFYVGNSLKAITGILGEISALVVLKRLFPTKTFAFQWVAQQTNAGKQLSVDILLKKGLQAYGIQIKNSSQINLNTLEIPMVSVTLDTFFDKEMRSQAE